MAARADCGWRDCFCKPCELLQRAEHWRKSVTGDHRCFALKETGENQCAMALQLRLEEEGFIEAGDGEPIAAVVD